MKTVPSQNHRVRIDIEATQEGDGNGGQQRAVECHEEAVDVEDRQAVMR